MAEEYFLPTKEDRDLFLLFKKELEKKLLNQRPKDNTPYRPIIPGTYIAKTPVDGIPARTGTTPGYAICQIHRINRDEAGNEVVALDDIEQLVFNIYSSEISGDTYIEIKQDRFGDWVVTPPGTGFTGTRTVVEHVSCIGGTLAVTTAEYEFENGLLKNVIE